MIPLNDTRSREYCEWMASVWREHLKRIQETKEKGA